MDQLSRHEKVSLKIYAEEAAPADEFRASFDPSEILPGRREALRRPQFLAIVSSSTLAVNLARKATGKVDGFVVENYTAGGHNAPPRGPKRLNEAGEPIYGERDHADLEEFKKLGLPFWLAGSYADPLKLKEALAFGAQGIQVGTAFAFCRESGFTVEIKANVVQKVLKGEARVFTDPVASPTNFPFKVVELEDSLSQKEIYEERPRVCDLGYLRMPYKKEDSILGYRCPGEPKRPPGASVCAIPFWPTWVWGRPIRTAPMKRT